MSSDDLYRLALYNGILLVAFTSLILALEARRKHSPSGGERQPSQLWSRYKTLLVLAVVFILLPYYPPALSLLVMVLALVAAWECLALLPALGIRPYGKISMALTLSIPLATTVYGLYGWLASIALLAMAASAACCVKQIRRHALPSLAVAWYTGGLSSFMILIRAPETGYGSWIFFLFVVQFTDVGAFFAGKYLGRHRLAPRISPAKTWEGVAGGLLAALVVALLFRFTVPAFTLAETVVFAVLMTLTGLLGDLAASAFKRKVGVKDFSSLLPGHGGVMDRFDSYLFSAPFAWWLLLP